MLLSQPQALKLLRKYSIKYPKTVILSKAIQILKYPVVLKVDSPKVLHKTDAGLVFTGLKSKAEVRKKVKEAETILKKLKVKDYNFVLQETAKGVEVIVGMKRDPSFGPVIMFGLGGVLVEVVKDVSMRIAPLKRKDCFEMINEVQGKKLLEGYRGMPKVNKEKLVQLLMKVSKLAMKEDLAEIDLNPVMVNEKSAVVVDARMIHA